MMVLISTSTSNVNELPLSLVLTFFLLFSAFGTVWDATIIMLNLPVALLGGLVVAGRRWRVALAARALLVGFALFLFFLIVLRYQSQMLYDARDRQLTRTQSNI